MKKVLVLILAVSVSLMIFSQEISFDGMVSDQVYQSETNIISNLSRWATTATPDISKSITQEGESNITISIVDKVPLNYDSIQNWGYEVELKKITLNVESKQGRYKVDIDNPIIHIAPALIDFRYYRTKHILIIKANLEAIKDLSRDYFNETLAFDAKTIFKAKDEIAENIKELEANLETYTQNKDKKNIRFSQNNIEKANIKLKVLNVAIKELKKGVDNVLSEISELTDPDEW